MKATEIISRILALGSTEQADMIRVNEKECVLDTLNDYFTEWDDVYESEYLWLRRNKVRYFLYIYENQLPMSKNEDIFAIIRDREGSIIYIYEIE